MTDADLSFGGGGGGSSAAAPVEEAKVAAPAAVEKTHFDVKLKSFDAAQKLKVIKEVRAVTGLGLKEVCFVWYGVTLPLCAHACTHPSW